jgi:hypothetical protein
VIDPQIDDDPLATTDRVLRQFAGLWLVFFGGLACWLGLVRERTSLALALAALALGIGSLGLARPRAMRPIFTGMMAITYPIGWVVSHLALALLFFGVFTPVALLFKLIGRDSLTRRRSDQPSYWARHPVVGDVRAYFRQS